MKQTSRPAKHAAPNPLTGWVTTIAPSAQARAAVSSEDPLSTTMGR
jgi:hypothetical protein